jgi:hypothetical protein
VPFDVHYTAMSRRRAGLPKQEVVMAANPFLTEAETHEAKATRVPEPREGIITLRQRVKNFLYKVFSGHEEFQGLTPD